MSKVNFRELGICTALLATATCLAGAANLSALEFSASNYAVVTAAAAVTVTVDRVGGSSGNAIASYETIDGSAVSGTDYVAASGTLNWSDGDAAPKSFTVPIRPNGSGNHNFTVALISASGATFGTPSSASVSISENPANLFPKIAVSTTGGSQVFNSANNTLLAQYGLITIGGNFPEWPDYGISRSALVSSLKGQTHTGKNALTPFIAQYENMNEMPLPTPSTEWFPEWNAVVDKNNWYVFERGSSGPKTPSAFDSSYVLANPAHVVGTDPTTGLYPYALAARLLY